MRTATQKRPRFFAIAVLALVIVAFLDLSGSAQANGFPGKGDPADWSDALPYYNSGNHLLNEQRYSEAARRYRQAIAKYEFDPDFYINLGVALRKMEDYSSAEQAFKKAIELNDKDWSAWSDLGNVYLKQDRLEDTIGCFEHALRCNPPAAERTAIQGDIGDIHKVLRNMGREPLPGSKDQTATAQAKSKTAKKQVHAHPSSPKLQRRSSAPSAVPQTPTKDWGYQ